MRRWCCWRPRASYRGAAGEGRRQRRRRRGRAATVSEADAAAGDVEDATAAGLDVGAAVAKGGRAAVNQKTRSSCRRCYGTTTRLNGGSRSSWQDCWRWRWRCASGRSRDRCGRCGRLSPPRQGAAAAVAAAGGSAGAGGLSPGSSQLERPSQHCRSSQTGSSSSLASLTRRAPARTGCCACRGDRSSASCD